MRLKSARQVWHDATKTDCRSSFEALMEVERLGVHVQTTAKSHANDQIARSTIAGHVLSAIDKLPTHVRAFGEYMYSAEPCSYSAQVALYAVFNSAVVCAKLNPAKKKAGLAIAAALLEAYRLRHQGGQSAGIVMFPSARALREHVQSKAGITLDARNWSRDWEAFVQGCTDACDELDARALSPIAALLYRIKDNC